MKNNKINVKRKFGIIIILLISIFIASSSLSGCATSRATAASGATGAIFGAGTGFVLGALAGGPIGAIIGTAAGLSIGYGLGYVTGKYVVTREGNIRGISLRHIPYRLSSNEFVYRTAGHPKINFKEIKGVIVSNLGIYTDPKSVKAGNKIDLVMEYDVLGAPRLIRNYSVKETRILKGLDGKVLYAHTTNADVKREGYYKTNLFLTLPKHTPKIYIYEAIVKVNDAVVALSSRLVEVRLR